MGKISIPSSIIRKLKEYAPTYEVSENYGRRSGFYGDSNESARGYKAICIYIQNGIAEHIDLFKEVAKGIFKIQADNQRKYPLLVFGFGNRTHLQHEQKYSVIANQSANNVAKAISKISPVPARLLRGDKAWN